MYAFVCIILQLNFFMEAALSFKDCWIALGMLYGMYWYMWIPSVMVVIITYILLMKIYPYKEEAKGW